MRIVQGPPGAGIKSIQRHAALLAGATLSSNVTITAVDVDKTVLHVSQNVGLDSRFHRATCKLTSATNVQVDRVLGGTNTNVNIYILEFY